ncbi:MAG: pseudaminic acid cytidylyltransferase [Prevotellaceae bacterium]|jgi:N-acylneuraminate cytidylyltransferase|nr:pseudaminic acid cytidylyltransferase [Prevotellaceae bacterium]
MKNIAVIPARGGSKRIPRKNIKPFLGKPIIAYSIEAALQTQLFDEVMVSTDDEEIAIIAKQYGANVPFLRSEAASNDFATTADVLNEVISKYEKQNQVFDNMCCFYPTAPLIQPKNIIDAYQKLTTGAFSSVYPIVAFSYPIWRCLDLENDGSISRHWKEFENSRSQDLPKTYHDSGTFYWYKVQEWKSGNVKTGGIIVDEIKVQDIDTETDWKLAELKYKLLYEKISEE